MPQISVIIPVYNSSGTLTAALDSVLAQKGADFEIIAVDDGSTDDSLELLNEKFGHDSRVKIISQANGGPSAARMAAVGISESEWLYFHDSDDIMLPGALAGMLAVAETDTQIDMVEPEFTIRYTDGMETSSRPAHPTTSGVGQLGEILRDRGHWTLSVLLRRSLLKYLTYTSEGMLLGEDAIWKTQILLASRKVASYPRAAFIYTQRTSSTASEIPDDRKFQNYLNHIRLIDKYITASRHAEVLAEPLAFYHKVTTFQRLEWRRPEGLADALMRVREDAKRFPQLARTLNRHQHKILRYFAFGRKIGTWRLNRRLNKRR